MLHSFIEGLQQNPWLWVITTGLGIIGLVADRISNYKYNKKLSLTYEMKSVNLLKNNHHNIDGLNITYNGAEYSNLSLTNIVLWNNGNKVIRRSDIASDDPLKVFTNDSSQILEKKILKVNQSLNKIQVIKDTENEITFDFEYLEPKNGMVLQILHTGEKKSIDVSCTLIDGYRVISVEKMSKELYSKFRRNRKKKSNSDILRKSFRTTVGFNLLILLVMIGLKAFLPKAAYLSFINSGIPFIINCVFIIFFTLLYALSLKYALYRSVPKDLQIVELSDYWLFLDYIQY